MISFRTSQVLKTGILETDTCVASWGTWSLISGDGLTTRGWCPASQGAHCPAARAGPCLRGPCPCIGAGSVFTLPEPGKTGRTPCARRVPSWAGSISPGPAPRHSPCTQPLLSSLHGASLGRKIQYQLGKERDRKSDTENTTLNLFFFLI